MMKEGSKRRLQTTTSAAPAIPVALSIAPDATTVAIDSSAMGSPTSLVEPLTREDIQRDIFQLFDAHKAQRLRCTELRTALLMLGADATREQLQDFQATHCAEPKRGYTFDEFVRVVELARRTSGQDAAKGIGALFDAYDSDHSGFWTSKHLAKLGADVAAVTKALELEDGAEEGQSSSGMTSASSSMFIGLHQPGNARIDSAPPADSDPSMTDPIFAADARDIERFAATCFADLGCEANRVTRDGFTEMMKSLAATL